MSDSVTAEEHRLTPETKLDELCKTLQAGDKIVLENGIWENVELDFSTLPGTAAAPISIVAEAPGQVVFRGEVAFCVSGDHVVISGITFRDCHGVDSVFELRTEDGEVAQSFRVTECVFDQSANIESAKETTWLAVYGVNHRIDHCYFGGKTTRGATIVVWVADHPEKHRIDHNHFGPRPRLGKSGGETLRIGDSKNSESPSQTVVEDNYFYRCDGEAEIISNKSCENIYRHNVFEACSGALTLRHGHRCLVEGNVFVGNEEKGTGGVRVIGQGHRVVNNYLHGLRGDEERAAIAMMNGIPNGPLNGYAPVKDVIIAHNTLVDCKVSMAIGVGAGKEKQSVSPANCLVANNVISSGKWEPFRVHADPVGFRWKGNKQEIGRDYEDMLGEFDRVSLRLRGGDDALMRPADPATLITEAVTEMTITTDIDGETRSEKVIAGCDDPATQTRTFASATSTGPEWRRNNFNNEEADDE